MKKQVLMLMLLLVSGISQAQRGIVKPPEQSPADRAIIPDNAAFKEVEEAAPATEAANDTEETAATETDGNLKAIHDELKSLREKIETDGEKQVIGRLMIKEKVWIYKRNTANLSMKNNGIYKPRIKGKAVKEPFTQANVDSIIIKTQEGYITDISVYANNQKFVNRCVISLTKRRHELIADLLSDRKNEYFIYYQDVVDFDAVKQYISDDDDFTLKQTPDEKKIHYFKRGNEFKSVFDLRVYTDALGVFAGEDNGLVQVDGRSKFYLHQSNVWDRSAFIFHYMKVNINFAKFDSKSENVQYSEYSRSTLLQRSWFNATLGLNLFEGYIKQIYNTQYYIDAGGLISAATIDSAGVTRDVTSSTIWGEAGMCVKAGDNAGINGYLNMGLNYSPQTKDIDLAGNEPHVFIRPGFEVFYSPFGEVNKVFARVNYWLDTWNSSTQQNQFWQFQIGYNTTLSKLSKKTED